MKDSVKEYFGADHIFHYATHRTDWDDPIQKALEEIVCLDNNAGSNFSRDLEDDLDNGYLIISEYCHTTIIYKLSDLGIEYVKLMMI